MLQVLRRNFGLKVLAFALAVTAWAYFHYSAAPSITAHFDQQLSVPIVATGLRPGFVTAYAERNAIVTVEVPRNGAPVRADQVRAVIDLADRATPGIINVPVRVVAPQAVVKSLTPASVTLALDRTEERQFPLNIAYTGGNGALVVDAASVTPTAATVRGIVSDLAKVQVVKIDIPLASKAGAFDAMVRPVAADARGAEISSVQVSPNLVRVRARFSPATNSAGVRP